jgi:hypothetical protein
VILKVHAEFTLFDIELFPKHQQDTASTLSKGRETLESLNTTHSCDPKSFIALYSFKGDEDDQLSIKANQEVGVMKLGTYYRPILYIPTKMSLSSLYMLTHTFRL